MKYTPKQYAAAISALVTEGGVSEKELIGNFIKTIERNGDMPQREKILHEADRALRRTYGKRTVMLETARPLKDLQKKFTKFITKNDVIERQINPSLVAGVRVTIDDEDQFDGTLKYKLDRIFS